MANLKNLLSSIVELLPWREESSLIQAREELAENFPEETHSVDAGVKDSDGNAVQFPPAPE